MSGVAWTALVGGIIALVGQFWGAGFYLPAIGGVVAIVAAIMAFNE